MYKAFNILIGSPCRQELRCLVLAKEMSEAVMCVLGDDTQSEILRVELIDTDSVMVVGATLDDTTKEPYDEREAEALHKHLSEQKGVLCN